MYVNGKETKLAIAPQKISGKIYIPLRALEKDALGKKVFSSRGVIVISDKDKIVDGAKESQLLDMLTMLFKQFILTN